MCSTFPLSCPGAADSTGSRGAQPMNCEVIGAMGEISQTTLTPLSRASIDYS